MKTGLARAAPIAGLLALAAAASTDGLPQGAQAWLEQNGVPVLSLDPAAPLDDLQPLKPILAKARIVQLGEASHGDGADFRAKVRLIRLLHEELGFNVLAFESGLYECESANRDIRPGQDPRAPMRDSIFGVWHAEEVVPLFEYLCREAGTAHPLRLTGFDPQVSGGLGRELIPDVLRFLGPEVTRGLDVQPLAQFYALANAERLEEAAPQMEGAAQVLDRLRAVCSANAGPLTQRYGAREVCYCSRVLGNLVVWLALKRIRIEDKLAGRETEKHGRYTDVRDAQMADNLRWLAEEHYPGEKIIVWAHNFHLSHGFHELTRDVHANYGQSHPMGAQVKQHFGDQVYTLGFCAYDGVSGWVSKEFLRVPDPGRGSLPAALHALGHSFAFVDLQSGGPLSGLFTCGFMEHAPLEAAWSRSFDGVFFVDYMTPATKIGDKPFPLASLPSPNAPLLNGDVEIGRSDLPLGWGHSREEEAGVSWAWDRAVAHSGTGSLCVADTDPTSDRLTMWSQQTRDGGSGRYTLSAFIRSEGLAEGASAAVCVQCRSAECKQIGFATTQKESVRLTGTRDWTEVRVEFEAPEGTTSFLAFAFLKGTGKVWFDDIQLAKQ